jgi:hypothetical protein
MFTVYNILLPTFEEVITSVDELDLSDTSVDIVVATLKRFYGEIRKADGTLYAKKYIFSSVHQL